VTAVAISSDSRLAIGKADGEIHLWDLNTDKRVSRFRAHPGGVWALEFAADGDYLASGGVDRVVRLWGGKTGESVLTLRGHTGEVRAVCFDPLGRRIASASSDGTIRVWDRDRPPEGWILDTDCGRINAFATHDEKLAVAGRERLRVATIRDTGPDEASWSVPRVGTSIVGRKPDLEQDRPEGELAVQYAPDGIIVVSEQGEVNVRPLDDPNSREVEPLSLGGPITAAAIAPNNTLIAVGRANGQVALWSLTDRRELASWQAHTSPIRVICFGDNHHLVTGSYNGKLKFWNLDTLQEQAAVEDGAEVLTAAISPDGKWLVTGLANQIAQVWSLQNHTKTWTLRGHLDAVTAVTFSPDSRRIVTGGRDGMLKVWDVSTGYELLTLPSGTDSISAIAFSPDGALLFAGRTNGTVRILSGKPIAGSLAKN
jgi:WD40 repeat protein